MNNKYIPATDADKVSWLNNLKVKLPQYAETLDVTEDEVTDVENAARMFEHVFLTLNAYKQTVQALTSLKNQLRSSLLQTLMSNLPQPPYIGDPPDLVNNGIFNRIPLLIARIKQHPNYTTAIGQDLDLIPAETPFNPNDMLPDLTVKLDAGHPLLRWKKGVADGVHIYVDRHDGNGFVLLARTVKNQYLDTSALPPNTFSVTWEYKVRYLFGDDEVGQFSQVISVNVLRSV